MTRRMLGPAAAAVALLLLIACASPGSRPAPTPTGPTPTAPAPIGPTPSNVPVGQFSAGWTTYAATITGVRPGSDANSVLIDVRLPAGAIPCARDLSVQVLDETAQAVDANVVDELWGPVRMGTCPSIAPGTVRLTAANPIGDRLIVLNTHPWRLSNGVYAPCGENSLCDPPADHCAAQGIDFAATGLDVPAHSGRSIEHCDPNWLIMTVDINTAQCGAGGRPGCSAPPDIARYFFQWNNAGWVDIARTTTAGCDVVLHAVPSFPRDLCDRLPATG